MKSNPQFHDFSTVHKKASTKRKENFSSSSSSGNKRPVFERFRDFSKGNKELLLLHHQSL
jgi:hypothetical protein